MKMRTVELLIETGFAPSEARGYQLLREGRVPGAVRVGRCWRIIEDVFLDAVRERALRQNESVDVAGVR